MTSILFHEPTSRKRKHRVNSGNLFEFDNFNPGSTSAGAPFRDSVRVFLDNFAEMEDYTVNGMRVWCTSLVSEKEGVFPLYIVKETVHDHSLDLPFCYHCQSSGWGHHFVCKRKYHLIIPAKENWNVPLDWNFTELKSHNLYGLIHCNGYGHLICINGLKDKSNFFTTDDIMEFWNRLCTVLNARSISVSNLSRREAIELCLIHGAAYGKSWFEKWGYKCIGVTEKKYNKAIRFLSSLRLAKVISDLKDERNRKRIKEMIEKSRKLSEKPVNTISDLLMLLLAFESRIEIDICTYDSETVENPIGLDAFVGSMTKDCRWSAERLKNVISVILDPLKEHKANNTEGRFGMSRYELREEARKSVGDTGLIDFVLKSIKTLKVDSQIIRRKINPVTKLAEFTIHESLPRMDDFDGLDLKISPNIRFIYQNILRGYSQAQVILNSKPFVKEWPVRGEIVNNHLMKLTCKVLPSFDDLETELARKLSPGEVVVVEPWITIGDLKMVVQFALRDTYCVMDKFEVDQIGGLRKVDEEEVVHRAVEPGAMVWVRGHGLDLGTRLRYEDGYMPAKCPRISGWL